MSFKASNFLHNLQYVYCVLVFLEVRKSHHLSGKQLEFRISFFMETSVHRMVNRMAESSRRPQMYEIPQEMARILYEEGALLIIAGVPAGTEIGVDLSPNRADEMFRGIKMIPPGAHFVYTAAENTYGDTAARVGFIHYFKKQEIIIREWNEQSEELRPRSKANLELDKVRIRDNLSELDRQVIIVFYVCPR